MPFAAHTRRMVLVFAIGIVVGHAAVSGGEPAASGRPGFQPIPSVPLPNDTVETWYRGYPFLPVTQVPPELLAAVGAHDADGLQGMIPTLDAILGEHTLALLREADAVTAYLVRPAGRPEDADLRPSDRVGFFVPVGHGVPVVPDAVTGFLTAMQDIENYGHDCLCPKSADFAFRFTGKGGTVDLVFNLVNPTVSILVHGEDWHQRRWNASPLLMAEACMVAARSLRDEVFLRKIEIFRAAHPGRGH